MLVHELLSHIRNQYMKTVYSSLKKTKVNEMPNPIVDKQQDEKDVGH